MSLVHKRRRHTRRTQIARLVDWEQDYHLVIAPVNRALGCEAQAVKYLHWWTFLAVYQEIGGCTFAQVVSIP